MPKVPVLGLLYPLIFSAKAASLPCDRTLSCQQIKDALSARKEANGGFNGDNG